MESVVLERVHSTPDKLQIKNEGDLESIVKTEDYEDNDSRIPGNDLMLQETSEECCSESHLPFDMKVNSSDRDSQSCHDELLPPDKQLRHFTNEESCLTAKSLNADIQYDNDETVIVYPSPLLSTNEGDFVNLVHLQNDVDSTISDLPYNSNVVLQQNFASDDQIAVITNTHDGQLGLLGAQSSDSIAYFQTSEGSVEGHDADEQTFLPDHILQFPTGDSEGSTPTIAVPLSVVNDSFFSGLKIGQIPVTVGTDVSDSLSLPMNIQTSNFGPVNSSQPYVLARLSSKEQQLSKNHVVVKVPKNKEKPLKKPLKQGQVGRPPKIQPSQKVIGSGPTAISAQGIVQEINNRLVTVLPRPEDLKKLMDSKQLIYPLKTNSGLRLSHDRRKSSNKLSQKPKVNLPKPQNDFEIDENIVLDMTLPDGDRASAVLIGGKTLQQDDACDLQATWPKFEYPKFRKKRGRRRGRGTYTLSSGRRPGRPKKVHTLLQGPKGPRFIHTGPPTVQSTALKDESSVQFEIKIETVHDKEAINVDEVKKEDSLDEKISIEINENRRQLPPRKRGLRYKRMMQALKQESDEDFSDGEDISPDYSIANKKVTFFKPKGTSGPGKRGRPRKEPQKLDTPQVVDSEGTRIIQLGENLKPITTETSSSILISEGHNKDHDLITPPVEPQHKLIITFEQQKTGEMVIHHVPVHSDDNEKINTPVIDNADISIVKQADDPYEDAATIFVKEDGHYEKGYECSECDMVHLFKRDYIRHLKQAHNIRPYECDQCRKTFTSKVALQEHILTHALEKPHRCNHCGMGFSEAVLLKTHIASHSVKSFDCDECGKKFLNQSLYKKHFFHEDFADEFKCKECSIEFTCKGLVADHSCQNIKCFECDICHLQFFSSSGLNRHRKVHKRNESEEQNNTEEFRCTSCQAMFTYESNLLKHMDMFHGGHCTFGAKDDDNVIQQLERKLNEGYAPKNSELYDEPAENETLGTKSKDPFLCGICNASFNDIDLLCGHYTTSHTTDQNLFCDLCGVGCTNEMQLQNHKLIHIEEEKKSLIYDENNESSFVCYTCGKSFRKSIDLIKHKKLHTQGKKFKCPYCYAAFGLKSALDKHLLVHTGQRPFRCDICFKSFRQSAALIRHKLWTHRLKNQNKCELCSKTFFTRELLYFHLDTHGEDGQLAKSHLAKKPADIDEKESLEEGKLALGVEDSDSSKKGICEYCGKECSSYVALLTHKLTHKLSASYKCDVCHRTFREKRFLKKHKLTHKGLKVWNCEICRKTFATKLTLIRHAHVHLREAITPDLREILKSEDLKDEDAESAGKVSSLPSVLRCDECNTDFTHKSHYVRHKLLHAGIPLLKCGLCDKMFVHKSDMIRHKVMHSFLFTCDVCGRNFHKRALYVMHRKKHFDDKPFKCDKCPKSFSSSGNYNIHKRIHSGEKPYWCDICDYKCSQSGRLLKHKRMHAGIKPYSCDICDKHFVNQESVKIHQRVHTGERPFQCQHCTKSFINSNSLNHHMRDHVKEEAFKCDICPHKFKKQEHLEKHRQFHMLQQQYQENIALKLDPEANIEGNLYMCEICGRVFNRKKYLYTHHNVHSRSRDYICSFCQKNLTSRLALKNHMLIHTGEMPHKCCVCEKEFRNLCHLKRHEKSHCTQEMFNCDECDEILYSRELLDEHKQEHVNFMMINSEVETVSDPVNDTLYAFHEMNEAMDSSQELLAENSQQQFLVDGSQSLLSFPDGSTETYTAEIPEPEPVPVPIPITQNPQQEKVPEVDVMDTNAAIRDEDDNPPAIILNKITEPEVLMEERPLERTHQCDICFKTFAKKQYLTKHKYRHRPIKPHICELCGKGFAQKFEVAVHKIKHTGAKPYQCNYCQKEFRSKINLANHKMHHTGEYPYLCSVCNKGLSTQLQLEKHVSLHTGAVAYKCDYCPKGYALRISLEKHLIRAHENELKNLTVPGDFDRNRTIDQMETMEAISNMPQIEEEKTTLIATMMDKGAIKQEVVHMDHVGRVDIPSMDGELDVHFNILKTCLLETSHDVDDATKFLTIFHSRTDSTSDQMDNDDDELNVRQDS